MRTSFLPVSLRLTVALLLLAPNLCLSRPHRRHHSHERDRLARAGFATASTTPTPTVVHSLSKNSCTIPYATQTVTPDGYTYDTICGVDFIGQNIYPFLLTSSFEACMEQCDLINQSDGDGVTQCVGFVYVPERSHDVDDCYLKSALNSAVPATISLLGATRTQVSTMALAIATSSFPSLVPSILPSSTFSLTGLSKVLRPKVANARLIGPSINNPTLQWVYHPPTLPEKLASNQLVPGINEQLITNYPIAEDTGSLVTTNLTTNLKDLSVVPHTSRDGGKGGQINGTHLFIFCDTAGFTTTNATHKGDMVSFVSSSVAIDTGMNALHGQALTLVDEIGEWQDDVGRMRGYAPMTTGEEAFNIALSGKGYRYAVWPESSLIPLNNTHSIQYASLVYDNVDMTTQAANFTTLGNTLLTTWIDPNYGPAAERTVKRLFNENEVCWGSVGGIRSWGASGVGGTDGKVYVFGKVEPGLLLGRTSPDGISDRTSYQYWDGSSWSSKMLPTTSTAYFIDGSFMDVDMFYSPYHATFIIVCLTSDGDNTFYYRHLEAPKPIFPSYAGGDPNTDYVENIAKYTWSEPQVLYKAATPPAGNYIYAGAVHAGYFGDDDITNGGTYMLISWTQHTGLDAATPQSGYSHMTAVVSLEL